MNISVFGTGYVGLVTGVCLADLGHNVYCLDIDESKIRSINNGQAPFFEPGLNKLLTKNLSRITATTDITASVLKSEIIIIAVGTPFDGNQIDLKYVRQVASDLGEILSRSSDYKVVVVKSTVVPGTTEREVMQQILSKSGKNGDQLGFCMNPEFLREGSAIVDFVEPDRIVLGVSSSRAESLLKEMYQVYSNSDFIVTSPTTAEMIKYTANAYLALHISYANEIARLCERLDDVDSETVFYGVKLDKRISPKLEGKRVNPQLNTYLKAGCGFGGSCFPKDVAALAAYFKTEGLNASMLNSILEINSTQVNHVFNFGIKHCGLPVKQISILGTAFKPDTDDIRESPGIKLAKIAFESGYSLNIHDYFALENTKKEIGDHANYFQDPLKAIAGSELIFVTTAWDQYTDLTDEEIESAMKKDALLIDTRSIYIDRVQKSWRKRTGLGPSR